ncbi:hypothetical protein N825_01395 [Skermanella stibiiresistens SB22]|uniref:Rhamnogalacturonase A/B/Epimerase-like pectate lyase domain-containing protein n=1 Tax=Skermanella stibiiresistens SB22 TaxID=1385369 RepID=W9HA39_9PROT|nr:glycosyl hydrolase family 28-related protein [Skermanella stibiiresistens]EWY42839.1 hypothetical protein N825_01395 [Skermanella stibiiresistens SB22]
MIILSRKAASGRWRRSNGGPSIEAAWFGAKGDGATNDTVALKAALGAARRSGGQVRLGPGIFKLNQTLEISSRVSLVGAGRGITTLGLMPNSDCDVVATVDFKRRSKTSGLSEAPWGFAIKDLTIDGGYLDGNWNASEANVTNRVGSGLKIFGRSFEIDVEVNNVAEHALHCEGYGPRGASDVRSVIRLNGRVAGREGVIFRGPGDIAIEELVFGLCGILPRPRADKEAVPSTQFPGEQVDGLVIDGSKPFEGNVELGRVHIYACFGGTGFRTRGGCRIEARHVTSESNLGGVSLSSSTHGFISGLAVRNNGRHHPNRTGTPPAPLPGARIDCRNGFMISACGIFRSIVRESLEGWPGLLITGTGNSITVHHQNSTNPKTGTAYSGPAIVVEGDLNTVSGTIHDVVGDAAIIRGNLNTITLVVNGCTGAALRREARRDGDLSRGEGNNLEAVFSRCGTGFQSDGSARVERVALVTTDRMRQADAFKGSPASSAGQKWELTDTPP